MQGRGEVRIPKKLPLWRDSVAHGGLLLVKELLHDEE